MSSYYPEEISDEELRKCDTITFRGEIVLVDSVEAFDKVISQLKGIRILGFDTETKPSFKKGKKNRVSMLQIAVADKAFLFRLNIIGLPNALAEILADPLVIKVGAAIHDDIKELQERCFFTPAGFIDLQKVVKHYGLKSYSVKKMAAIILGVKISKGQQVTNWSASRLTTSQVIYAATDAWICYEIYNELLSKNSLLIKTL